MRPQPFLGLLFLLITSFPALAAGGWGSPVMVGQLDATLLPEASGIAQSILDPGRIYHVNDRGAVPSVVVTQASGAGARRVLLDTEALVDAEDLATGPCPDHGSCLYIADIGDNNFQRSFVTVYVVRETRDLVEPLPIAFAVTISYSDGRAHNAEGFSIHPSGDAYILTKETPAIFYRVSLSALQTQTKLIVEPVASINLLPWLDGTDKPNKLIPTGLAIRGDGAQLVILTRAAGLTLDIDLFGIGGGAVIDLNRLIARGEAFAARLPMLRVPQSEAVTYINGSTAILYSSEAAKPEVTTVPLVMIPRLR